MAQGNRYNGWANYQTWNVALWISNDEGLYLTALECKDYATFCARVEEAGGNASISYRTPDGVSWSDSALDIEELDEMIREMRNEEARDEDE